MSRLYVGNLSWNVTEGDLRAAFSADSRQVKNVTVMMDRDSGRPRGFAFVEMGSKADADAAIQALNGKDLDGRPIKVNEAKERPQRSGGFDGSSGHRNPGGGRW
jgi:RNA recognition motif-containing protein